MAIGEIAGSNRVAQATINAAGAVNTLMLPVGGYGSAGFALAAGTLSATITPQVSFDGKDTWLDWEFEDPLTGLKLDALTVANPNAARSLTIQPPGGTTHLRLFVTSYTSGSASAILVLTEMTRPARQPRALLAQTGLLTTTATTANQEVLSYTVPADKTLFLKWFKVNVRSTSPPGNPNPVVFGEWSLETPSGTKCFTMDPIGNVSPHPMGLDLSEPWEIPAGQVVRVVCTPAAATSFRWRANFGGYLVP